MWYNVIMIIFNTKFQKTLSAQDQRLLRLFRHMHDRCNTASEHGYKYYVKRGITVCERWSKSIDGFRNFLSDMGRCPEGLSRNNKRAEYTLDRVDNDKGYSPDNCKWATMSEQNKNKRAWSEEERNKKRGENNHMSIANRERRRKLKLDALA